MCVKEKEREGEEREECEKRAVEKIKEVANSIEKCIQLEEDYPGKHETRRVPILDIQCWVEERVKEGGEEGGEQGGRK